jgi:hypothetical protein
MASAELSRRVEKVVGYSRSPAASRTRPGDGTRFRLTAASARRDLLSGTDTNGLLQLQVSAIEHRDPGGYVVVMAVAEMFGSVDRAREGRFAVEQLSPTAESEGNLPDLVTVGSGHAGVNPAIAGARASRCVASSLEAQLQAEARWGRRRRVDHHDVAGGQP